MKKVLWYVTWRNKEYLWFLESDYKSLFVITSVCLDMNTSEWLNFRILNIEHFAKIAKIYSEPIKWLNFRHNLWPIKLAKYYFECISSIQQSSKNHTKWNLAVFHENFCENFVNIFGTDQMTNFLAFFRALYFWIRLKYTAMF